MKLIGNLKKQVERTNSSAEARDIIEKAGMKLTDDELYMVTGGCEMSLDLEAIRNGNVSTVAGNAVPTVGGNAVPMVEENDILGKSLSKLGLKAKR